MIVQFRMLMICICLFSMGRTSAADIPQPEKTKPNEPLAKTFSVAKAAEYLDGVGVNWTRDRKCVTCHTNMPYLMARPTIKGQGDDGWKEVRKFLEDDVTRWSSGGKPRGDAYVVATAAGLVFSDIHTTGKLHDTTKTALDRIWTIQQNTGEWRWLKCEWPPMEHDDYYGAALVAVVVGHAPGQYAQTDVAKQGIEKLKKYFSKTPPPDLHHQAMLLWASAKIDGLMTNPEKADTIEKLKKLQHADGGWCLPALGKYSRRDEKKTPNDPNAESDGYATGMIVYILKQAGMKNDDPAVTKGIQWLKQNQRESGRWFTRSLNNDKAHYITNAGSAFAILALDSCGELK